MLGDCGDRGGDALCAGACAEPDAVFHAAAYKQVPLLEAQLREAVRNNVLATETVARASREAGVGTFVLISTDKAVDPVNVLGATKRLAEMVCQATGRPACRRAWSPCASATCSIRPAAWCRCSASRSARGGPVTVTHPEVTRYFMTIPEACQLILQAVGDRLRSRRSTRSTWASRCRSACSPSR